MQELIQQALQLVNQQPEPATPQKKHVEANSELTAAQNVRAKAAVATAAAPRAPTGGTSQVELHLQAECEQEATVRAGSSAQQESSQAEAQRTAWPAETERSTWQLSSVG